MPGTAGTTCRDIIREISAYLEGVLSPRERERIEGHCGTCPNCALYLAEWRAMVAALGQLEERRQQVSDAEKARLVGLFREGGHHHGRARIPDIPLGLDRALAAPGDHFAYFWETEQEFLATAGFVAAGEEHGESAVILCHEEARDRLAAALGSIGLDVEKLRRGKRLSFVSGAKSADALLEEVDEQIRSAVDRGAPLVRVLGSLGWRQRGGPEELELLRLEARVTEAVRKLPVVVACTYEVDRVPGRILLLSGLECHPLVFRRNALRDNALYVPAGTAPSIPSSAGPAPEGGDRIIAHPDPDPTANPPKRSTE
jgi:hypothetical protein